MSERRIPAAVHRVLFVSRKFPPAVGGMETLAADVWRAVDHRWPGSKVIAQGGPAWRSLVWIPVGVVRTAVALISGRFDALIVGDAMMATALRPVGWIGRRPKLAFVMGLDLTWDLPGYRALVRWGLRGWGRIAAISQATADVAADLTGEPGKVSVIRLGVQVPTGGEDAVTARAAIAARWSIPTDSLILLTLGRVVKRKGSAWFVEHVVPEIPGAWYLVAGSGPEVEEVAAAASRAGVADRLVLTGSVSEESREQLLVGCDLFIQPNIAVPGDMEGFGLVVVEAVLRGAVVLAADLEGLKDAVIDGSTGYLVPSGDARAWKMRIDKLSDPADRTGVSTEFRANAADLFGPEKMEQRLSELVEEIPTQQLGH